MHRKSRLLGLAFAAADILIELDNDGRIAFAMGSAPAPGGASPEEWVGSHLEERLGKASRAAVTAVIKHLVEGARSPPAEILLICGETLVRRAKLRAFRLPQLAPALSCAITFEGVPFPLAVPLSPPLLDGEGLLERARARLIDTPVEEAMALAFVDVPGLSSVAGEQGERASARVTAALQSASLGGSSVARLTSERFALIKAASDSRDLASEVREAGQAEGFDFSPRAAEAALQHGTDAVSTLKAMRFTIEGCLRDGGLEHPERTFSQTLKKTLSDADKFRVMVRARQFDLHYQPIVDMRTGAVHHFEALARFGANGPASAIHMAEELGLIEDFDLAVLERALRKLRQPGNGLVKVAVNVSAASLATDTYLNALARSTAAEPHERQRLMLEVTETAALADLEAADARLRALRKFGVKICIDDFGSGSTSFDYLRGLSVDSVKIDGGFIRDLDVNPRSRTLVTHLVELCSSLRLTTVAEMIETEAVAQAVRSIGVDYGQGWLFGRAEPEPRTTLADRATAPAQRRGEVVAWG